MFASSFLKSSNVHKYDHKTPQILFLQASTSQSTSLELTFPAFEGMKKMEVESIASLDATDADAYAQHNLIMLREPL